MAAPVIAAAALAGAGMSAYGGIQAGKSAQDSADYNAAVARNEAVARRQKARFDQVRQSKEGSRIKGTMAARAGASGARTDVGAPVLAAARQAEEIELDNLLIGFEGETMAKRSESQAQMDEFGGQVTKQAGKFKAGASLLQGFSSAAMAYGGGGGKPEKPMARRSAAKGVG